MPAACIELWLPDWLCERTERWDRGENDTIDSRADRMRLAVELARRNVETGTGGPFGAAVFERDSGRLVSVGVNVVVASRASLAHAEMLALALAQRALGTHDLGAAGLPAHELVSSSEPCAMCFGALPWSGIRRLVCGARAADAAAIGFDEGPKPADWVAQLETRGIEVRRDVERSAARAVLDTYRTQGGPIYGSGGRGEGGTF